MLNVFRDELFFSLPYQQRTVKFEIIAHGRVDSPCGELGTPAELQQLQFSAGRLTIAGPAIICSFYSNDIRLGPYVAASIVTVRVSSL
jgi:hypothetical protein